MTLLLGFAFLAGIVTILSPCILPVLPVLLAGTTGQGKARPWGIVLGFVISFTTFTLALSALVQFLGIPADLLRWLAATLVLGFGLILLVPQLKDRFLAWTTRLTTRTTALPRRGGGLVGGVVLGFSLGLVWTPCVGPIMASVISLSLSQSVTWDSVAITAAYSLGTALPMLAILLGGRQLLARFPFFAQRSNEIQRVFGGLMLLTALSLFTGFDRTIQTWLLTTFPSYGAGLTALEDQPSVRAELERRQPEARTGDPLSLGLGDRESGPWLNSPPLTLAGLQGKVVLVDIWTFSCVNCVRTLPYLRSWYDKYRAQGLEIVGVHSPEFAFEQSSANVLRAMKELGVVWPVVQDNAFGIWNAYQNQYWPAHFLYGRDGTLLETHFGEGHYAETEAAIAAALGVPVAGTAEPAGLIEVGDGPRTAETYLGYARGKRFASPEDVVQDAPALYTGPAELKPDRWALEGTWTIGSESSLSAPGGRLTVNIRAAKVYLVVSPEGAASTALVTLDGKPLTGGDVKAGQLILDASRMYQLLDLPEATTGVLEVTTSGRVNVYALTFG